MRKFSSDISQASFGWCSRCNVEHRLEQGDARHHALELMRKLEDLQHIDFGSSSNESNPRYSTDYLYGPALGQMFGILECEDKQGNLVVLRAFSCQYNAEWEVDGWVPPVFDIEAYHQIMIPADQKIKELGRRIDGLENDLIKGKRLREERKRLSQSAMKELQDLYQLQNFRGDHRPLKEFFRDTKGPPAGAGDCCAPKLLNHAACNQLRPLSIAEFYWGKTNRSQTCEQGHFYSSCLDKCQPILGFMLCGLEP